MSCSICHEGELREQHDVDHWVLRGDRWVLVQELDALVCDECGHKFFTREAVGQIELAADETNDLRPNDWAVWLGVYKAKHPKHAPAAMVPFTDSAEPGPSKTARSKTEDYTTVPSASP